MEINDRILKIIDYERLNNNSFSKKIGVNPQTMHTIVKEKKTKPSFDVLNKILISFPEIDANWLLTGDGEMFKQDLKPDIETRLESIESEIRELKRTVDYLSGKDSPENRK